MVSTTRQDYDKRPVIQVDYAFLVDKIETITEGATASAATRLNITVLTACDVITGMVLAAVVKVKGAIDYAVNELRRLILERGRSNDTAVRSRTGDSSTLPQSCSKSLNFDQTIARTQLTIARIGGIVA